jgi:TonB family protein
MSCKLAAQSAGGDAPRRIKVAVKPEYSALAKRLNLSGSVRVEVQIEPNGKVKRARVVGGNPVLAVDAEKAAMLTEFEPAAKESTQVIEFHFDPAN